MTRSTQIIAGVLALLYGAFWFWYGGNGEPMSGAETEAYLSRITAIGERSKHPDPEILEAFGRLAGQDDGREYYMINLMKYREKAVYPEGYDYDDDVRAAADRYAAAVVPALLKRGSLPILLARVQGSFLDFEGAEEWDEVGIVRYRSRRAMLEMALELGELDLGVHKWASLEKTHVFPAEPIFDFVFVRSAVALLLFSIGFVLHRTLRALRSGA